MKLREIEIEQIKADKHPKYLWRPRPMIWGKPVKEL